VKGITVAYFKILRYYFFWMDCGKRRIIAAEILTRDHQITRQE